MEKKNSKSLYCKRNKVMYIRQIFVKSLQSNIILCVHVNTY